MDKDDKLIFSEDIRRRRNSLHSFFSKIKYGIPKNKIVYSKSNSLYIDKTASITLNGKLFLSRNQRGINDSKSILILQKNAKLICKGEFSFAYGADIRLFDGATLILGNNSYINNNLLLRGANKIEIGNDCAISYNCSIFDDDFHNISYDGMIKNRDNNYVSIGDHVWIGANVTILKGVTIGNNSVIAAGSVVTNSIPSNVLAAGNPAKVIKEISYWQ